MICGVMPLAHGQQYPSRAITFIYPYPAGGASDSAWRLIGQEAGKRLGQTLVHDNRPGAAGRLGVDALMRSAKDGYTIGLVNQTTAVNQPLIDQKLYIEPGKDYAPVVLGIDTAFVLSGRAGAPFTDLKGLLAYAKANPGKLNAASSGLGSGTHLAIEMLKGMAGVGIVHVPYNGQAPAVAALVGGQVDLLFGSAEIKPMIAAGKAIGIATTSEKRWAQFPDLPTVAETGLSRYVNGSWNGVAVPADTPRDVVMKLNRGYNDALRTPEVKEKLESAGWILMGGTPEDFTALTRSTMELFRPVVKAANLRMD